MNMYSTVSISVGICRKEGVLNYFGLKCKCERWVGIGKPHVYRKKDKNNVFARDDRNVVCMNI